MSPNGPSKPLVQSPTLAEDVLLHILWRLEVEQLRGTLRSAGLVCQAWYHPTMDILWADTSPVRLLQVLSPMENKGGYWHFLQPLTSYSWSRFHSLAYRVRSIEVKLSCDPTLVSELSRTNPKPGPLLPNVRRLFLRETRIQHFLIWMSPALENLDIFLHTRRSAKRGVVQDSQTISDFFSQMGALCPNLIDLRLATEEIGKDSIAIAAQTIGKLHHLRTVYLRSNVDDVTAIVSKIAELPALESLSLDCLVGFPSSWLPSPTPPFPQLKKLCVERPSNPGTTAFLHSLATTGSRLMELELGQEYYSQIKDPKEMMRLVGEHIGLESLVMYNKYNRAGIFFDTLRPILQCHSLTKMKLDMGGNMRLTDDDIETLASGLPKLEHIALLSRGFSPSSLLTLRALSIAVARWPYLETLSIIVDARNSVPREQHVHNTPHQHLAQLTVGNSPISDDANDVTSFIGGLSEVEGFRIQYDPFGRSGELWGAVSAALPAMRVKRVAEWSGLAADRG